MVTRLKIVRTEQGLKQWRLASLLGISQTELSHYEVGRRRCPIQLRYKLAEVLKVPVDKLFPEERTQ